MWDGLGANSTTCLSVNSTIFQGTGEESATRADSVIIHLTICINKDTPDIRGTFWENRSRAHFL